MTNVRCSAALILVVLGTALALGCGTRDNPPSSRAGNVKRIPDSVAAAFAGDTARAAATPGTAPAPEASRSDPRAAALAQRLIAALGGERAWNSTRCWYFTYAVSDSRAERFRRTHYWERPTGRHRLEGTDRRQRPYVVIHTLGDSTGCTVLRSGAPVADLAERHALCRAADSLWMNDSTWLLLPFKLLDPGAELAYGGTANDGEKTWDVIDLAFDSRPLAPRGHYRLFIERSTGLLERTAIASKKGAESAGPIYEWLGWRLFGGVLVAGERRPKGPGLAILFPQLAVLDVFPADTFTAPEPVELPAL